MKKARRIVAWLTILVIIGLIVGAVICAVTGSKYFYGMFFLALATPVVLWVFMWFAHLIHGDSQVIPKEDLEKPEDEKEKI